MRLPHRNPPHPAPYVPTQEELQRLVRSLQQERAQSLFGQTTRQLVNYFQVQQGLGESSIDPQGNYEIRYDAAQFQRAEKGTADLRVAVCGPGGRELVSSDILFNAGPETTIDLTAGPESEYERYLADLEPVLQPLALIDIDGEDAEDQRKDLDFLAGDTGIDRQRIAWLVRAAGFEVKSKGIDLEIRSAAIARGIPAAAFYAWFRQGIPDQWDALVAEPIDNLRTALLAAIKQDTIGAEFRTRIEAILDAMPSR